ncbi:MAG: hypothetical protein H7A46_15325 [Verrucomicrobiales bacterium]|nr:hypothetical protein [Verrucomicrobiales bacterium]
MQYLLPGFAARAAGTLSPWTGESEAKRTRRLRRTGSRISGPPVLLLAWLTGAWGVQAASLDCSVSWLGNSFSGASNKWVQNFFIHTRVQPDGTVNTWSHWDEGGRRFGAYKDGEVIGNTNVYPNSLATTDRAGRHWRMEFDCVEPKFHEHDIKRRGITCDGRPVKFPDLHEPMALALANDGQLMVADSQTSARQQILFYDSTDPTVPKLMRTFGDCGGIGSGTPGEVTPTKFQGIRGMVMDAAGNLYVAMSGMGACLREFSPEGHLLWELRGDFFVDLACAGPTRQRRVSRVRGGRPQGEGAALSLEAMSGSSVCICVTLENRVIQPKT